jgi:hypothetical protein
MPHVFDSVLLTKQDEGGAGKEPTVQKPLAVMRADRKGAAISPVCSARHPLKRADSGAKEWLQLAGLSMEK